MNFASFLHLLVTTVLPNETEKFDYQATGPIPADQAVGDLFSGTANWLVATVGIIAVIFLIVGGIQYVLALGDSAKMDTAKRTLKWTLFGIILAAVAFVIVPTVAKLLQ